MILGSHEKRHARQPLVEAWTSRIDVRLDHVEGRQKRWISTILLFQVREVLRSAKDHGMSAFGEATGELLS